MPIFPLGVCLLLVEFEKLYYLCVLIYSVLSWTQAGSTLVLGSVPYEASLTLAQFQLFPFPLGEELLMSSGYIRSSKNLGFSHSAALILLPQSTQASSSSLNPSAGGHTTPLMCTLLSPRGDQQITICREVGTLYRFGHKHQCVHTLCTVLVKPKPTFCFKLKKKSRNSGDTKK